MAGRILGSQQSIDVMKDEQIPALSSREQLATVARDQASDDGRMCREQVGLAGLGSDFDGDGGSIHFRWTTRSEP